MSKHLIEELVKIKGIDSDYIDAWGRPATIAHDNQIKLLNAMGYDLSDESRLNEQLSNEAICEWLTALNPVYVFRKSQIVELAVRVSIQDAGEVHTLVINLEKGDTQKIKFVPADCKLVAAQEIDGIEYHQYMLTIDAPLAIGYHQISLRKARKNIASSCLIFAPDACYIPRDLANGKKYWGLSVQLYCLKSKRNWGIGDFSDLCYLVENAAKLGADFIGLNPIHALFPASPDACSPYGPSSRRWINFLYIDIESIAGFSSSVVQDYLKENDTYSKLHELRETEFVDYEGVAEQKLGVLAVLYAHYCSHYLNKNSKQKRQFDQFVEKGGDSLHTLAVFEALQLKFKEEEKPYWGWQVFPPAYQEAHLPAVKRFAKKHAYDVDFHKFLQWQATLQFDAASKAAKSAGMKIGLYRDLAVGVGDGSAEIWGNQSLYCTNVSVGAPPDVLGPLGQKWGLPPMEPDALYQQAYQPIIDLFESNMHASGALRIDHVMALLRLWWVHKDDDATDGAYVNYPIDDLLAVLALESQRNKSIVIGEDLGTVPDSIRTKLQENGIYSYRVFFFEQAEDGGFYSPAHYPVQSMSTLTTHDMPTLSGFWHCDDLVLGKELGVYPDEAVLNALYADRHASKQRILDSLHGHQSIPDTISRDVNYVGMSTALNHGMQVHMAKGSSTLLSLQLEDWLEMEKPVNIPGTFKEYPNWKRKLSHDLEDIFTRNDIQTLAASITQGRVGASQP
ncbi:4-alpha-glucanotransferase [Agaribacter flavus]|uniref:4-alpha-glucanotransferase n=1 Tax=Agaribacter flavus TaxID=1902781 RepID=A0ABV7FJN0_9ALTE